MITKVEGVQSQTGGTTNPFVKPRSRGERGTGTTITIDLSEYPELLEKIRDAAKADDREASKWLRRRIVQLGKALFEGGAA
jgi:hypothetical protein